MKQILQNLGSGETILADVPCPRRSNGSVLIQTRQTLVSLGTEKMLIDFGRGGYLAKARSQPDKVKQVLQKIKTDGLWTTVDAVKAKLDAPIPLGYCNVGVVDSCSEQSAFTVGDRVVSNGPHAEMVSVPENLVAKIPDSVTDEEATYTVVAAIGLQGIRLIQPTLGERIVVSGLGLIGLLTVQMLRAQGCQVLGIDFDERKLALAKQFGAQVVDLSKGEDPVRAAELWTDGIGVDGVVITASTKSDELVHQAATMCRKRGRIVLVGVIGLNLRRADFYEKELSFQVSCSYGPGRYDPNYEKLGLDYPIGFVRWTEKRNFEAVLQLMADNKLDTASLSTHRFSFDDALDGYQAIYDKTALGIVLDYPAHDVVQKRSQLLPMQAQSDVPARSSDRPSLAFIGAGAFTTRMLLPLLPDAKVVRHSIVSQTGVSASHAAKKFGFANCGTDVGTILNQAEVDAVFVTTPHNTHAAIVADAMDHGKHVFVEKPLAMTTEELTSIEEAMERNPAQRFVIGFNRRFSPHTVAVKSWLSAATGPKTAVITVNAGMIPADHWTQDRTVGGGRIIGEACHFIDLARFMIDSPIVDVNATPMSGGDGRLGDCATIQLSFADGSIASVHYLSNGSKAFPKERVEVFAGGNVAVINNFRQSSVIGGKQTLKTRRQDKGHAAEVESFVDTVCRRGEWLISAQEMFEVSRATLQADQQIREKL
ncbi:bi-domain-containing oxidoreductase [Rhodopirellula sp. MGV]|uniref:bi-domain-containing oxidoreductase n=1 Tax=Rhodopirellula sp. MGV TaxID=2023130 RepID=UPI000B95F1DB|nr:bi-domain-containing oxidoreductase [Rhodopirellula sp. MGV]OYP37315.1 dehydrogenase [Rhodopirellula sp. MGV]PNY36405.1 dehydrogenase [Rhodopirellula baltica]